MSSGAASPTLERGRPDPGRVGRRLGVAVFWLLLFYMVAMSAFSIIPSLFWPELAPRPRPLGLARCAEELTTLDHELLDHAANTIRGDASATDATWFASWDARHMALAGGCGPLEGARNDLNILRTRVKALLRSYRGGPNKTQQRILRALEQVQQLREPARSKGRHERE